VLLPAGRRADVPLGIRAARLAGRERVVGVGLRAHAGIGGPLRSLERSAPSGRRRPRPWSNRDDGDLVAYERPASVGECPAAAAAPIPPRHEPMRNPWRAVFLAFLVALPFLGRGLAQDAPATQTVDPESAGAREAELAEDSRGLVAGAARADITPPPGLPLWGYGSRRDTPARGTRDPLEATALVIGAGGRRMALVGLDLGRPPAREAMKAIEDRVRTEAGVESLFLVASHTHHGPCVELESVEPTASWIETASERIGGAV